MGFRHALLLLVVSLASPLAGVRGVLELRQEAGDCGMGCCVEGEPSCCGSREGEPKMSASCGCDEGSPGAHTLPLGLDWLPAPVGSEAVRPRPRAAALLDEPPPPTAAPEPPAKPPRR